MGETGGQREGRRGTRSDQPGDGRRLPSADIGLEGVTRDRLKTIGDTCASEGSLCESHCFGVTSEAVVDAMIAADALGTDRKSLAGV